jgi:hypothetical protein
VSAILIGTAGFTGLPVSTKTAAGPVQHSTPMISE